MLAISRRNALIAMGGAALALPFLGRVVPAQEMQVTKEMILNDPAAPVAGNPNGDLTIVNFTDYNCPFCKRVKPDLDRVVEEDGKIRMVYKDWPVIRPTSVDGATMALAAKYQGRYDVAHDALMSIPGTDVPRERMRSTLQAAGIDMARLDADMTVHAADIDALLRRNMAQADALGLTGTPSFLIGPFRTSTLDYEGFKQVISDARAEQARQ